MRIAILFCALAAFGEALAQLPVSEAENSGVPPTAELRLDEHSGPTPSAIPGARVVLTAELRRMLQTGSDAAPILFDTLGEDRHLSLPGAIWLPGAGRGTSFDDEVQARLSKLLDFATQGNRGRPLVFFCANARCWLSYNAALRAARLGYSNVLWYRGGIESWGAGGGALAEPEMVWQRQ